jgi:hypothetical protein
MNHIWLVEPNPLHNNFGLMAQGEPRFVAMVDGIVLRDLVPHRTDDPRHEEKRSWGAFHQGSARDWTYWEFWAPQTLEFRARVEAAIESIRSELDGLFKPVLGMPKGE